MIEEGGDWDRRNRLKVYQGTYCIAVRNFKEAANFFLDTISTFTSYELMDYNTFVRYTVYLSMISLPRNELRDKIIKGSEILEVLHSNQDVKDYLFSLYNCHYADFFKNLGKLIDKAKIFVLFGETLSLSKYCFSTCGRFAASRLFSISALSILCSRNADSRVHTTTGILSIFNSSVYG